MSPLRMGSKQVKALSGQELAERSGALREALRLGGAQLDPASVRAAGVVIDKVEERTSRLGSHTVVALAGATGSGKSSLFNALVGSPVATVGARRPTTSRPVAAVWGDQDATELLDWLSVSQRHHVDGAAGGVDGDGPGAGSGVAPAALGDGAAGRLDGLVLLDLPDFDSRVEANRVEAQRILELVDVFVWVTDPQKYADARLHDDYLKALSTHDAVTVVVLNQADRLTDGDAAQIRQDLARLTAADGIPRVQVIATSAVSGRGVEDLRFRLATAVSAQNAAQHRLAADIRATAARLRGDVAPTEPTLSERVDAELVEALSRAAGIPTVVAAVERDYRNQAWGRTGWPFTRWVRGLRPDPMKRLRLNSGDAVAEKLSLTAGDVRTVLGRSSLPPPTPAARASVDLATRKVGDEAAEGLPPRWAEAVADAATPPGPELADALDQAVVGTSLRVRAPFWWRAFGLVQLVLAAAAVGGFLWLTVLFVLGWMSLHVGDAPSVGHVPIPLLLFAGGLLLGLLLAWLARALARVGARRRGQRIRKRLVGAVTAVAVEQIVEPVGAVLERHRSTRSALDRAAA
ncbi:GTPase [Pedococcus sp. 5OH_020]|uniref:GTPase n=1 Tax=Pedococcus sp. 5OH_020 TaxID=2989814 RepID=UPI0022E9ABB9|nr:GTPase [Pedococcus sp. 5OH_020]